MFDEGESDNDSQYSIGSKDAPYDFDETHPVATQLFDDLGST
jgi:hypothetical protein